jgi:type II secretory pathway component PulJ
MAGSKMKLQNKLPGSTILEVVVAMVILILVFGTAMMIFTNVTRLSLSVKKLRAQAILQEILLQAGHTETNSDQLAREGEFRIEQEIKPFENEPALDQMIITAYDENQQQIAQVQQIIPHADTQH